MLKNKLPLKKKEIYFFDLKNQISFSIKNILLFYFLNLKSKNNNLNSFFNNYIKDFSFNILNLLDTDEQNNIKFTDFLQQSIHNQSIDENTFFSYYKTIQLLNNNTSFNPSNSFNFFNDTLILLALHIDQNLISKYYSDYNLNQYNNIIEKYSINSIIFSTISEYNDINKQLLDTYEKNYKLNLTKKLNPNNINYQFTHIINDLQNQLNQQVLIIDNLSNFITGKSSFNPLLYKKELNSHIKGLIGENFFSQSVNGVVIGSLGEKTDVISNDVSYSIKSTYSNSFNHHLAYLSKNQLTTDFSINNLQLFEENHNNFHNLLISFFYNNKKLDNLILQKIEMDSFNQFVTKSTQYVIPLTFITQIIDSNSYFFNSNEILFSFEKTQVFKLSFKQRKNNIQIMFISNIDVLDLLSNKNVISKKIISNTQTKSITNNKKF